MDKYQQLREVGQRLEKEVIGMSWNDAKKVCDYLGFRYRALSANGQAAIITADCRMDRLGCHIVDNKVTEASVG